MNNHGLIWNGHDLRLLKKIMAGGGTLVAAAAKLQRSPSACEAMYREIRRMEMMRFGSDDDNLRTWEAKKR